MEFIIQSLDDLLASLQPLDVDWKDETALHAIARLQGLPLKSSYSHQDIRALLDEHFDEGLLVARLFLGLSKDQFSAALKETLGDAGIGATSYKREPDAFVEALVTQGVLDAMSKEVNRELSWTDVLVERLRSGRGSAIAGQRRGRSIEDFVEAIVRKVFGANVRTRCNFVGPKGAEAKCDFAIPAKDNPSIVIEVKGYGATGSKMTDVIGDIEKIISAKRSDAALLFFTDGLSWNQRKSDLRKIVEYQNTGGIRRIYTLAMAAQFEADLLTLRDENRLAAS